MPDGDPPAARARHGRAPARRRPGGLRIAVSDEAGRPLAARGLAQWLRRVAPRRATGTVSIAIVSDRRILTLNRQYRHKPYATDVLSFPNHQSFANQPSAIGNQPLVLGDVVIAQGVARRQAREAGHSIDTELRVLALHGLLHLLGYDHERDDGEMRRLEQRLLRQGGVREGLIDRAAAVHDGRRRGRRDQLHVGGSIATGDRRHRPVSPRQPLRRAAR